MTRYIPTIGVEVHVELATRTKMFCPCPHSSGALGVNQAVCPVCLGLPGALPTVNAEAARLGLRAACALNCRINPALRFERKNYQYPDLVKGYQISQYAIPLGEWGHIDLPPEDIDPDFDAHDAPDGGLRVVIRRAHLEEDTAKLVHAGGGALVDANRSSAPLLEIVTEPVFHSAKAAESYVRRLQRILVHHKVSNCRPEAGEMRVEANISIAPVGAKEPGVRVEIKNQAGFQFMHGAIEFEIKRHAAVLDAGGRLRQETRGWNPDKGETFFQRTKEDAHDYRYFPDPDLPAPVIPAEWIEAERARTAETLENITEVLLSRGLSPKTLDMIVRAKALGYFNNAVATMDSCKKIAEKIQKDADSWLWAQGIKRMDVIILGKRFTNDVFAILNRHGWSMGRVEANLRHLSFVNIVALEALGRVRPDGTARVLEHVIDKGLAIGNSVIKVAERLGELDGAMPGETEEDRRERQAVLGMVDKIGVLVTGDGDGPEPKAVAEVLAEHPDWVADFRAGNVKVRNSLFGAVKKKLAGKGDSKAIADLLDQKLAGD